MANSKPAQPVAHQRLFPDHHQPVHRKNKSRALMQQQSSMFKIESHLQRAVEYFIN